MDRFDAMIALELHGSATIARRFGFVENLKATGTTTTKTG